MSLAAMSLRQQLSCPDGFLPFGAGLAHHGGLLTARHRMFCVGPDVAAAVQTAFHENGEWAAVVELRRHFPIQSNERAIEAVRLIASWHVPRIATTQLPRQS